MDNEGKHKGGFVDFSGDEIEEKAGEGVDTFLKKVQKRKEEQKLPPDDRLKVAKERARQKARKRQWKRVTYDLPPELVKRLSKIADDKGISRSRLVAWLLTRALEEFGDSAEELHDLLMPYLEPSRARKYVWNLRVQLGESDG
jgi:hypothetical protein